MLLASFAVATLAVTVVQGESAAQAPPAPIVVPAQSRAETPSPALLPNYGGYWTFMERGTPEPPDGQEERTKGSILLALGLLRAGAGAAELVLSRPSACGKDKRLDLSTGQCRAFAAYAGTGIVFGAALAVSGITYLAIASHHRRVHKRWSERRSGAAARIRFDGLALHF